MTREEATEVLKQYLFDEDEKIAEDVKKFDEALRMAIEALSEPINCVKCEHYTETEDEDGVKGRCKREKHQLSGEIPTESTNTPTDLISREDAIDAVQGWMGNQEHDYYLKRVEEDIESLPSADRQQGKWIEHGDNHGHSSYFCSRCGTQEGEQSGFCPNCGADMRGKK